MKQVILSLILATGLSFGQETIYQIDKTHSQIGFSVKHLMITNVHGRFTDYESVLSWNPTSPEKSKFEVTIQTKSINTEVEKRDEHLKGADFFDVEKFPTIKFISKKMTKKGKNFLVTGDLTIKEITKTVSIPFSALGPVKDPWGNVKVAFEGEFKINRKDYGLSWNKTLDNGGMLISEDVVITIAVETNKAN